MKRAQTQLSSTQRWRILHEEGLELAETTNKIICKLKSKGVNAVETPQGLF